MCQQKVGKKKKLKNPFENFTNLFMLFRWQNNNYSRHTSSHTYTHIELQMANDHQRNTEQEWNKPGELAIQPASKQHHNFPY
jgi:hypothetical protein